MTADLAAAADAAFASAHNALTQEALYNIIIAASAPETMAGNLSWMREAVDRLRQLLPYPGPTAVEKIRTRFHDLENIAPALQVHANLRKTLGAIKDEAHWLSNERLEKSIGEVLSREAADPNEIAAILDEATTATRHDETIARAALRKLPAEEDGLRFERAILIDDLDWQVAQIRHAVELATARFPIDDVEVAGSVMDAIPHIDALRAQDRDVLIITDLGLPNSIGEEPTMLGGEQILDRVKSLPDVVRRRVTTIVVSAQGRVGKKITTDFASVLRENPDGFIPKQHAWTTHLESSVRCLVTPPSIREAELDVLSFSKRTALLDGVPLVFGPMGFAWLDALADHRRVPLPAGLCELVPDAGYPPQPKTMKELALSVMLSALPRLPDDTHEWWEDVRQKGRDTYMGEYINGELRKQLARFGIPWEGELVSSAAPDGQRNRKEVASDDWEYALTVRRIRRWTSESEYLRHVRASESRIPNILLIDQLRSHADELVRGLGEAMAGSITYAADVDDAATHTEGVRLDYVVLVIRRTGELALRDEVVRRFGAVPMVVLAPDDYPSTFEALHRRVMSDRPRREPGYGGGVRSWVLGRVWDPVVTSGDPYADGQAIGERLFLLAKSASRRRLKVHNEPKLHAITVCRSSPRDFVLDGKQCRLAARASGTACLLVLLAEREGIELSAPALIYALVRAGELSTREDNTDFDQALDRHIRRIRDGLAAGLKANGSDAVAADRSAREILRGENPYELWARVTIVENANDLEQVEADG
jgi:hypothetical protein